MGSTYEPMDSWVYPAMDRLYALGQIDTAYLGMRPWTRLSIVHILEAGSEKISDTDEDSDACRIYQALQKEFEPDVERLPGSQASACGNRERLYSFSRHLRHTVTR